MIVVDFDAPDRLRATARFDMPTSSPPRRAGAKTGGAARLRHLAMTIDQGSDRSRYQGVVALEGQGFEEAAHQYFRQSEQIPTRVRLAVAEQFEGGRRAYRAGGLMVQFLPTSPERLRQADLPPGDMPEGHPSNDSTAPAEDDAWVEARTLVETVEDSRTRRSGGVERAPALPPVPRARRARVRGAGRARGVPLLAERIMAMMRRFSPEDRRDMVGDNGRIGITCEFCSRFYDLDPARSRRRSLRRNRVEAQCIPIESERILYLFLRRIVHRRAGSHFFARCSGPRALRPTGMRSSVRPARSCCAPLRGGGASPRASIRDEAIARQFGGRERTDAAVRDTMRSVDQGRVHAHLARIGPKGRLGALDHVAGRRIVEHIGSPPETITTCGECTPTRLPGVTERLTPAISTSTQAEWQLPPLRTRRP